MSLKGALTHHRKGGAVRSPRGKMIFYCLRKSDFLTFAETNVIITGSKPHNP